MSKQKDVFWEIIKIFDQYRLLDNFIIIGSWAEYVYELSYLKNKGFISNLKTMDMDILIKNLRRITANVSLPSLLSEHGYIYDEDPLTGVSKFYKSAVIELEFIVREMGRGKTDPYKVDSLNIKAEGLRHLDILCDNSIKLEINNFNLWVPTPQAYILHKLIINKNRGVKKEKDIRAVNSILEYISTDENDVSQLKSIYNNLSKNDKKKVDTVCKENLIKLYPDFLL